MTAPLLLRRMRHRGRCREQNRLPRFVLADVGTDAATATDSDAVASTNEDQFTQPTKPHLEVVS